MLEWDDGMGVMKDLWESRLGADCEGPLMSCQSIVLKLEIGGEPAWCSCLSV